MKKVDCRSGNGLVGPPTEQPSGREVGEHDAAVLGQKDAIGRMLGEPEGSLARIEHGVESTAGPWLFSKARGC